MPVRYAVLFKVHFWDDFAARQFARLQSICHEGDIFVFMDHTARYTAAAVSVPIINATERDCRNLGLRVEPEGRLFWYCNDYPTYFLYERDATYDFYVVIEYDVACRHSLDQLVSEVAERGYGVVAEPHRVPISEWHWASTGQGIYDTIDQMRHGLFCFAIFSNAAVAVMFRRRQELTKLRDSEAFAKWPYGELFMSTEAHLAGFRSGTLSEFGSTAQYDWSPPTLESDASTASDFVHPMLDETRFIASCLKFTTDLTTFFDAESDLAQRLARCDPRVVHSLVLGELRRRREVPLIERFKREIQLDQVDAADVLPNVAKGKPTTQSSVCPWSRCDDVVRDSAGAVSGHITGRYSFHTGEDDPAWWMIDLLDPYHVSEIRLYNRLEFASRARELQVYASEIAMDWQLVGQSDSEHDFGGVDGNPCIIRPDAETSIRFVRLQTKGRSMLHLDQVEIIGELA